MAFIRWNENTHIWELAVDSLSKTTLFNHLPIENPTLPLDTVNKQYVDSLIPTGGPFVPYNGANQAVNLGNQNLFAGTPQFTGGVFPGRADGVSGIQSSWALFSHGSYGLFTDVGLYVGGPLYAVGGVEPSYLLRETNSTDFTIDTGGTFTISPQYAAIFMRHNGFLFVTWISDAAFSANPTTYILIPGGFTALRYAQAAAIIFFGSITVDARLEVYPGEQFIRVLANDGSALNGAGRFSGQIVIYVG